MTLDEESNTLLVSISNTTRASKYPVEKMFVNDENKTSVSEYPIEIILTDIEGLQKTYSL